MTLPEFNCLPTMIGSLPHTDAAAACRLVARYLTDIPAWPQLPKRSFKENMLAQFSQGLPGAAFEGEGISISSQDNEEALAELYAASIENRTDDYALTPEHAAGFFCFVKTEGLQPLAVKGQLTGPVTLGLGLVDLSRRAIIYDETLADAAARLLRLKAAWQEKALRKLSNRTIIFLDEPAMASYGSSYVSLSKERILSLLGEVLGGLKGIKGIHCCGNTEWSLILETSTDVLSFDAYNYATSLPLYPEAVRGFLAREGTIAWGIVPSEEKPLAEETVASLKDRLEEAIAPFTHQGIEFKYLLRRSLLTPSCGLGMLSEDAAEQALKLTAELSIKMRKSYL